MGCQAPAKGLRRGYEAPTTCEVNLLIINILTMWQKITKALLYDMGLTRCLPAPYKPLPSPYKGSAKVHIIIIRFKPDARVLIFRVYKRTTFTRKCHKSKI